MIYSCLFVLCRFDPSVLPTTFSQFNCTLTLALPPDDNSLTYQVGLTKITDEQLLSLSSKFEKPSKNTVVYYNLKSVLIMYLLNNFFYAIF